MFETEPLPPFSRLWSHPGVTITPHNAAVSDPDATAAAIAGHIRRYEAEAALVNVVDLRTGY